MCDCKKSLISCSFRSPVANLWDFKRRRHSTDAPIDSTSFSSLSLAWPKLDYKISFNSHHIQSISIWWNYPPTRHPLCSSRHIYCCSHDTHNFFNCIPYSQREMWFMTRQLKSKPCERDMRFPFHHINSRRVSREWKLEWRRTREEFNWVDQLSYKLLLPIKAWKFVAIWRKFLSGLRK